MNKSRILIVDDDVNITRLVTLLLVMRSGWEVRAENRPYAALATAKQFGPDLILLDVDMPGKDGGQIAAEFRAHPRFANVPIVFLTSLVSPHDTANGPIMRRGMPFLSKPVNHLVLERTINDLLDPASPAAA